MEATTIVVEGRRATELRRVLRDIDARLRRDGLGYLFADNPNVTATGAAAQPADCGKGGRD